MTKAQKIAKQHKDAVNKARRERYAAKNAAAADKLPPTNNTPPPLPNTPPDNIELPGNKADDTPPSTKRIKYFAARATDRGAIPLQEITVETNHSDIAKVLLGTGKVNFYDVIYIFAVPTISGQTNAGTIESKFIILPPSIVV